jgi:hypothetical protein
MGASGACLVLLLGLLLSPVFGADVLGYPFCDALRDSDSRAACLAYINAASSIGKWTSAVRWARFYRGSCEWPGWSCSRPRQSHASVPSVVLKPPATYEGLERGYMQPRQAQRPKSLLLLLLHCPACVVPACRPMCQRHGAVLAERHACRALRLDMYSSSQQQPL